MMAMSKVILYFYTMLCSLKLVARAPFVCDKIFFRCDSDTLTLSSNHLSPHQIKST